MKFSELALPAEGNSSAGRALSPASVRSEPAWSTAHLGDANEVADDVSKLSWSDLLQLSFGQTSTSTLVRVGEEALTK